MVIGQTKIKTIHYAKLFPVPRNIMQHPNKFEGLYKCVETNTLEYQAGNVEKHETLCDNLSANFGALVPVW